MLIDTHAHVNFSAFDKDRAETIKRALDRNIFMINIGCDEKSSDMAVKVAKENKKGVWAAVGIHPNDAAKRKVDFRVISNLAKEKEVVAIGETGLDYFRIKDISKDIEESKKIQKEYLKTHINLAKEAGKPLILHCRDAHDDMMQVLEEEFGKSKNKRNGVMHFFTGNATQAQKYIELGFLIAFGGVITFARNYDEAVLNTPLDKIVAETDAPYVTPEPFRGRRNEPAFVEYTARKLAQLKGVSFEELAQKTTANAKKLFRLNI